MLCGLLAGCATEIGTINVNADGSGTMEVKVGFTEEALKIMSSMSGGESVVEMEDAEVFTYNGQKCYGEIETVDFANINELNEIFGEMSSDGSSMNAPVFRLNSDGTFDITLELDGTALATYDSEMLDEESSLTYEQLQMLGMPDLVVVFEFNMPGLVTQIAGDTNGVSIDGNKLVLDYVKMSNNEPQKYAFKVAAPGQAAIKTDRLFDDVPENAWYTKAVLAMANGGLVSGYGNNKFGPEDKITAAQFSQILARAIGQETGTGHTGYWGEKAVEFCLNNGYIADRGGISAQNYDVPINREEAIAGLQKAFGSWYSHDGREFEAKDIPDYDEITNVYQEWVLAAYNSGLTSGVDTIHTFSPRGIVTRAQMCQMYYNIGITTAPAFITCEPPLMTPDVD